MKGAGKFLLGMTFFSLFVLVFVHLKIGSLLVSYDIHRYHKEISKKEEIYHTLKFNVNQLKAPHLLEAKMKQYNFDLALPQEIRVLEVPALPKWQAPLKQEMRLPTFAQGVSHMMGRLVKVAQAKTHS